MLILENFSFAGMVKLSGGLKNFGHGWLGSKMLSLQLHWRYGVIPPLLLNYYKMLIEIFKI